MSTIFVNTPINDFVLGFTLEEIEKCLYVAGKYGGKVFGGFIRDVIVPRLKDPSCKVNFKDVDLWFTSQSDADSFITEMKLMYVGRSYFGEHIKTFRPNPQLYSFDRTQYHLYMYGTCIAWFDIIISKSFPVDDFDVNFLSGLYDSNGKQLQSENSIKKNELVDAINTKEMSILSSYVDRLLSMDGDGYVHLNRINNRYIARGWTIVFDEDTKFSKPIQKSDLIKLKARFRPSDKGNITVQISSTNPNKLLEDFIRDDALVKEAIANRYKSYYKCAQHFGILDENFTTLIMRGNPKLEEDIMSSMVQKIAYQLKK